MIEKQIDLILDDLAQGRKTIDDLIAQKALYEGGNALLTSMVNEHGDHPIGEAFIILYESIRIVLFLLDRSLELMERAEHPDGASYACEDTELEYAYTLPDNL